MAIGSFNPPIRTLMGPGPSDVHPRILEAMSRPTIGHLDPAFIRMMDEVKELLQYAFQTRNAMTMPVSAPGSAGMETCFVNLVEPGDKVIVCQNGVFGGRMKENVERCGGEAILVQDAWGTAVDPQKLEDALAANPDANTVAFVHAETSTGVCQPLEDLARIAAQRAVDRVAYLGEFHVELGLGHQRDVGVAHPADAQQHERRGHGQAPGEGLRAHGHRQDGQERAHPHVTTEHQPPGAT